MQLMQKIKQYLFRHQPHPKETTVIQLADFCDVTEASDTTEIQHGTITIKNNRVVVKNPGPLGSFPALTIPSNQQIHVLIDGKQVVGKHLVHEGHTIEVRTNPSPPSITWSSRISQDMLNVFFTVHIEKGQEFRLKETDEASRNVHLELDSINCLPQPLTQDEIISALEKGGYVGEIDEVAIHELSLTTETTERIVVRGVSPIPGKRGYYELVYSEKDYDPLHRHMRLSTVYAGAILAVLQPELPGTPGRDVYGHAIPAPPNKKPQSLGPGVILIGNQVVAKRSGRLVYTNDLVDVVPELVIPHALTPKDGNIEFDGDVIVYGSLEDGCLIRATGTVTIHGNIYGSTVMAEKGIAIKGHVIKSIVIAGQSQLIYGNLLPQLKQSVRQFHLFQQEYNIVLEQATKRVHDEKTFGMIAHVLLRDRHPDLTTHFQALLEYHDITLCTSDALYNRLVHELKAKWIGLGSTQIHLRDISYVGNLLQEYRNYVELMKSTGVAHVKAANVTSSSIRASGKVLVLDSGVYSSSIESGDALFVKGNVRGGFLTAKRFIEIYEFGTPFGTETSAKVLDESGRIFIKRRHPNTLIEVGLYRNRNLLNETNVNFLGRAKNAHC
ncbi:FapA family protein [Alicyclobacillus tolerans]|uniref:FapA family protein n=1 Tax=Alicyclobacillus tolerans TaxID=90970 RepID=UPI001F3CD7C4|nr:FapA family protein [Alicyclobacillus tolerans]MCF8568134.1 FapA family protein [Alicyclobacillus tolerans]